VAALSASKRDGEFVLVGMIAEWPLLALKRSV
jgi:hypothetical protein